ncbi:uncharacterized protein LOC143285476 [Babylonia areolata]|uniref:uncharacterized protein LOC143285476 n=1 Tax=Babylonia areolata TaxID=304850 RepID=UPI003FD4C068
MRLDQFLFVVMKKFGVLFVVLFCDQCVQVVKGDTPTYIMSHYCGTVIDMKDLQLSTMRVRLTNQPAYRPRMNCNFALRAPPQHQLLMVVEWLDISAGGLSVACTDFFSAWNGELRNTTTNVDGLDVRVCGKEAPPPAASQGRSMTLHFNSNYQDEGAGFSILVTAFHQGQCDQEEFRCYNGRCIDERLKCDDDDNCGDGSDNCVLSVSTVALVVIVVTIVGAVLGGAVALYCHRDRLCGGKSAEETNGVNQPAMTESTTASTIPDSNAASA